MSKKSKIIWAIVLLPMAAVEIPGVLFFWNRMEPEILGVPFIYGFVFLCWIIQVAVILLACVLNWGEPVERK